MPLFPLASCEPNKTLKDGLYLGLGLGYDSFKVRQKLSFIENRGVIALLNPGLNVGGLLGSAFIGYGQYYCRLYIAGEAYANFSTANTNYEKASLTSVYNLAVDGRASYGGDILPGFKLNPFTLIYGRFGYLRTTFKSIENFINRATGTHFNTSSTKYCNGLHYGLGIESAIFHYFCNCCGDNYCDHFANNFSLRAEYSYTSYNSWLSDVNTSFTPANYQFVLSLIFHFA